MSKFQSQYTIFRYKPRCVVIRYVLLKLHYNVKPTSITRRILKEHLSDKLTLLISNNHDLQDNTTITNMVTSFAVIYVVHSPLRRKFPCQSPGPLHPPCTAKNRTRDFNSTTHTF
jgi:hypothetical protein